MPSPSNMSHRSNIVIKTDADTKKHFIIITNHKCGFTSINLLENILQVPLINQITVHPTYQFNFNKIQAEHNTETIYLFRSIIKRNISVFLQWGIDIPHKKGFSFLTTSIQNVAPPNIFAQFMQYVKNRDLIPAYTIFLNYLPRFYNRNIHFVPQSSIILQNRIKKVDHYINLDYAPDMEKFAKITNQPLAHKNPSNSTSKKQLEEFVKSNKQAQRLLAQIYQQDLIYFKKHNINV